MTDRPGGRARADYKRLLVEAYDLDKPEAPADELAFYRRHIDECGPPVLEVMSGSGRLLVPLLEAGIDIDGVDASEDMLDACRRKCAERGLHPALDHQTLDRLELPRRYGLVFCGGGSFGLIIHDDEVRKSLDRLFDYLLPGATLLLEVETPAARLRTRGWEGRWWRRPDGGLIVERANNRYDKASKVESGLGIYELFNDGVLVETELNEWVRRFWEPNVLRGMLGEAGFTNIEATKAYSSLPLDGDETMVSIRASRS